MPASVASRFYILLFQQRMVGWWEEKINLFIMIPGQTTQSQLSISNVHYSLRHQIISHTQQSFQKHPFNHSFCENEQLLRLRI